MRHQSEYVRDWAIQFLVEDKHPSEAARGEFARMAKDDPSAFVRLYLASALQRMPADERWPIAAGLLTHDEDAADHDLPLMIWYGIEPAVAEEPDRWLSLASDCKIGLVRRFIAKRISLIDSPRAAAAMESLVAGMADGKNSGVQADLLSGMRDALRGSRHEHMPAAWPATYARLVKSPLPSVHADAHALALIFGDQEAAKSLQRKAADVAAAVDDRREALAALVESRVPGLPELLQSLVGDASLRAAALEGLAAYDDPHTADVVLSRYRDFSPTEKRQAIETLVARPSFAAALLSAVGEKRVPAADISIEAARQMHNFKNRQIDDALAKVWGTLRESAADKKEQVQKYKNLLTPDFIKSADPVAGRGVFSQTCGKCHSLYGAGGKIGPDLTGANRGNIDYVLQKVVDPNTAVPADYLMQLITLNDGRLVSGIIRGRGPKGIVVQTETQLLTIAQDDIEQIKPSGQSMMPERQLDSLTREQIRDLFGYLATKSQVAQ